MANQYYKGKLIRISVEFTLNGVLTNPTTVTIKTLDPDGTLASYTDAINDSTGKYHKDVSGSKVGFWNIRVEGTGTVESTDESYFEILPSKF